MNLNIDREWLIRMAEEEANGIVSVGGLAATLRKEIPVQIVRYSIGVATPITPAEPLPAPPEIPMGSVVVVEGRAPIWRYGMALHRLHGSPAAAIAVFDPRLGGVVVASHHPDYREGQVLPVEG